MSILRAVLVGAGAYAASAYNDKTGQRQGQSIALGVGAGLVTYLLTMEDDKSGGTTQDISGDDSKLTFPKNQYDIFADGIEAAIWGTSFIAAWWEDDEAIASILKEMQNVDDVYELIDAYGVRNVGVLFASDGGNLVQMIQEYLDSDLKEEVNRVYKARKIDFLWP